MNVEALKNKITSKWLNYRPLGKTTRVQGKNFASFIGTSNSHVSDIIHDPTSSRRYFEYWVDAQCDWDSINAIDYLKLWRGIDEAQETTYINDILLELSDAQELVRAQDSVEEWLELEELRAESHDFIKPRQAYKFYMGFMEEQKKERFAVGIKRFFNRMVELELNEKDKDHGRYYKIKTPKNYGFEPMK